MLRIRQILATDAESFLRLNNALDDETKFMLLEPGERTTTVEEQRKRIQSLLTVPNHIILVAENDDLLGYVAAMGGPYRRNRHAAHVVIGVRQSRSGQGIGTALFHELEKWARGKKIYRLELTVMAHNARAIALYRKCGFEKEGTRRHALLVDGSYVDEHYMAKLLHE